MEGYNVTSDVKSVTEPMPLVIQGIAIEARASDNFVNATQMCKAGGKKLSNWVRLQSTQELIFELKAHLRALDVIDLKRGGAHEGTWIHPDLAVQLAQWISPSFAIQVSRWIRELFISGSVSIESHKTDAQLLELQKQLSIQQLELREKTEHLTRLHSINTELLTYKKLTTRNEVVYIVSTLNLAKQGLFKVGKTKNMRARVSTLNTAHPAGDKIKVLKEFKVNDASALEALIHKKLAGLRPEKGSEFFMVPYLSLYKIVELFVELDEEGNETVDELIDTVYRLKQQRFDELNWTDGLDLSVFQETLRIVEDNGKEMATFDMTNITEEQKRLFVAQCLQAYRQICAQETVTWPSLRAFIIERLQGLGIPKRLFRTMVWKDAIVDEGKNAQLKIAWRNRK